ncbi:MAG: hypothetical protein NVS3B21_09030 [Acidimicrobiales bacterium]
MQFAVEAWANEYGSPIEDSEVLATPQHPPLLDIEMAVEDWRPIAAPGPVARAARVAFTDGVRRVDARVWIADGPHTRLGLCASYAAGVVRATAAVGTEPARAVVVSCEVERGVFTCAPGAEPVRSRHATFEVRLVDSDEPDRLSLAVQHRMGELEVALVAQAGAADLVVVDGPLRGRQHVPHAIGYVKTHHVAYLPPIVEGIVAALAPGERTPVFVTTASWSRYSWYVRLPGRPGHPWAGVVRCEAPADLATIEAVHLAELSAATVGHFASSPHKDPRAPQNLYPIAGLERALRHRLGDAPLIYRSLRAAAAQP